MTAERVREIVREELKKAMRDPNNLKVLEHAIEAVSSRMLLRSLEEAMDNISKAADVKGDLAPAGESAYDAGKRIAKESSSENPAPKAPEGETQ